MIRSKFQFSYSLILLFCLLTVGCKKIPVTDSVIQAEYPLTVDEPSGLSFSGSSTQLLVVSDSDNKIYQISLSGQLTHTLGFTGMDLEGIAYNPQTDEIWVVEEQSREVVLLNSTGSEIKRYKVALSESTGNDGLEGITYHPERQHLFVLNEKNPGLLAEIDLDGNIVEEFKLKWADDYSGLFYDALSDELWIISDQSQLLSRCDLKGNPLHQYRLTFDKAEGVVIDINKKLAYIVNDKTSSLFVLKLD